MSLARPTKLDVKDIPLWGDDYFDSKLEVPSRLPNEK
jgi:hypothetical protein